MLLYFDQNEKGCQPRQGVVIDPKWPLEILTEKFPNVQSSSSLLESKILLIKACSYSVKVGKRWLGALRSHYITSLGYYYVSPQNMRPNLVIILLIQGLATLLEGAGYLLKYLKVNSQFFNFSWYKKCLRLADYANVLPLFCFKTRYTRFGARTQRKNFLLHIYANAT